MIERRRVLLFDWTTGGHHAIYLRRFCEALVGAYDVIVAVPPDLVGFVDDLPVEVSPLDSSRPREDRSKPLADQARTYGEQEVALLREAMVRTRPHRAVHLYGDPVLRRLVHQKVDLPVPLTLSLFSTRYHMRAAYGLSLSAAELARAVFQELLVARWRRRADAATLLALDDATAQAWAKRRRWPAYWLPEPPVDAPSLDGTGRDRSGALLYGAIDYRKGLEQLRDAVTSAPSTSRVTIAGPVAPEYAMTAEEAVASMKRSGAEVCVIDRRLSEHEALTLMGESRCVLLPYPRHMQMSRVLLEAAVSGTPVIANQNGVPGWLTTRHGLGLSVDCSDARALRRAMDAMDRDDPARWGASLAAFASRYSTEVFRTQVRSAIDA